MATAEVRFPAEEGGARSTTATGRAVVAAAAEAVDGALAARIRASRDWRKDYIGALCELTAVQVPVGAAQARPGDAARPGPAEAVAAAGLTALHERMLLGDARLAAGIPDAEGPRTARLTGEAAPVRELVVPYRGAELCGDALRAQLADWTARGIVEPAGAAAVATVVDHPEWLALPGRRVALVGAGAELAPLAPLLAWGADVLAVDVPSPRLWERVLATARGGAGRLAYPEEGLDLLRELPAVRAWLLAEAGDTPLVLGVHAYAHGRDHVRVAAAADALVADVLAVRPGSAFACLATPTDAFAVTPAIAAAARARWDRRGALGMVQRPLRALSGDRVFRPAYAQDGPPVADALVPQQGPNYALAKRVQRWRALDARAAGHMVSCNVAPASMTRSVTSNRLMAAAFGGAGRFGVEAFAPATTRALMAALLVHDLHVPAAAAGEEQLVAHAAHGGLWRTAYTPRSALWLAALAGAPGALRSTVGR